MTVFPYLEARLRTASSGSTAPVEVSGGPLSARPGAPTVGMLYTVADSVPPNRLDFWDGAAWVEGLGGSSTAPVEVLGDTLANRPPAPTNQTLFVVSDSVPADRIDFWDGAAWVTVSAGTGSVYSADGALTGDRVVDGATNSFTVDNASAVQLNSVANSTVLLNANAAVSSPGGVTLTSDTGVYTIGDGTAPSLPPDTAIPVDATALVVGSDGVVYRKPPPIVADTAAGLPDPTTVPVGTTASVVMDGANDGVYVAAAPVGGVAGLVGEIWVKS